MVYHTKVKFEQEKTVPTSPSILKSPKVTCISYNCYLINEQAIAQCDYYRLSIQNPNPTIFGKRCGIPNIKWQNFMIKPLNSQETSLVN